MIAMRLTTVAQEVHASSHGPRSMVGCQLEHERVRQLESGIFPGRDRIESQFRDTAHERNPELRKEAGRRLEAGFGGRSAVDRGACQIGHHGNLPTTPCQCSCA